MTRYIIQRLLLLPFLLLVYSFVIFVIMQAPPGDFLTAYVATLSATGTSITADQINALRHEYGLDQPFIVQYVYWLRELLTGHLGLSLEYQTAECRADRRAAWIDVGAGTDGVRADLDHRDTGGDLFGDTSTVAGSIMLSR